METHAKEVWAELLQEIEWLCCSIARGIRSRPRWKMLFYITLAVVIVLTLLNELYWRRQPPIDPALPIVLVGLLCVLHELRIAHAHLKVQGKVGQILNLGVQEAAHLQLGEEPPVFVVKYRGVAYSGWQPVNTLVWKVILLYGEPASNWCELLVLPASIKREGIIPLKTPLDLDDPETRGARLSVGTAHIAAGLVLADISAAQAFQRCTSTEEVEKGITLALRDSCSTFLGINDHMAMIQAFMQAASSTPYVPETLELEIKLADINSN